MRALVFCLAFALVASCDATYTVRVDAPYCPVSDSAKAKADSVSIFCVLPDGTTKR